ncbi:DUF262 domain-containing protein [Nitrosomonas aestuarii]|uniref:DUF262 domain-containing protein n=1 Tax=Nitrosomonas aestuarii TaxID=52441 RepID=UPI000D31BA20|nr:DUF262 domain-containing protein [Nitrosomonas aestuarii]PTN12706.1 uncharacterized protein DUF1524 [Nitrosomonas aestuarii]
MANFNSNMKFNIYGLGGVIANNKLIIPANQREYSWTELQIEALFQDIGKAIDLDNSTSYFVGTIVGIPHESGSKIEIIDGQQRLATVSIFLAEMMRFFNNKDNMLAKSVEEILFSVDRGKREVLPNLRLGRNDNDYFIYLLGKSLDDSKSPSSPSTEKLATARRIAQDRIKKIIAPYNKEKDQCDQLNQWLDYIEHGVQILLLTVNSNASAYKMFETLNDRGLKTTQSDLVKNYLFGASGERFEEVEIRWNSMKAILNGISDKDITIDFLRYALTCMVGYTKETEVYEFTEKYISSEQKAVNYAIQMESLAQSFAAVKMPEHDKWNGQLKSSRAAVRTLIMFSVKPIIPLQLAIVQKFTDKECKQAFEFLVSLTARLLIASSTRSGGQIYPLASVAENIYNGSITTTKQLKENLKTITPNDKEFSEAFSTFKSTKEEFSRYYIRGIETAITEDREAYYILNDNPAEITLEHIYPKKPQGNYPLINDDDSSLYLNRLGNQTLLQQSVNSELKSAAFEEKKKRFKESPYVLTSELAQYEGDWKAEYINDRQRRMSIYAIKAWPV